MDNQTRFLVSALEKKPATEIAGEAESPEPDEDAMEFSWRKLSESARRAAQFLAYLAPDPIAKPLWQTLDESLLSPETVAELAQCGYLMPVETIETGRLRPENVADHSDYYSPGLRPPYAAFVRTRNASPASDVLVWCRALERLLEPGKESNLQMIADCLPHADYLLSYLAVEPLDQQQAAAAIEFGMRIGVWRRSQGLFSDAEESDRRVLAIAEVKLGDQHVQTLACAAKLALVLALKDALEQARHRSENTPNIQPPSDAADQPEKLASRAPVPPVSGDLEAEHPLAEEERSAGKRSRGSEFSETIAVASALVLTLAAKGKLPASRVLQEEMLAICQNAHGLSHPWTIAAMNNLAVLLQQQGELVTAGKLLEQVVEIHKKNLGDRHPDTLTSLNNFASLLKARGDIEGARWLQEQVLERRKEVLGHEHPDTLVSMNNLATTLKMRGDLERSRILQEDVLRIRARVLGTDHPDTLTAVNNLASVLKAKGNLVKARKIQEYVYKKRKEVLGSDHPDTLTAMNNLASILKAQRQLEPALVLEQEVLDIRKKRLGTEHSATTIAAWNFTSTLILLRGGSAAKQPLEENLMWLMSERRDTLSGPQRQIKKMLKKLLESGQDLQV
jgi:tetratricopeptide (TPR) repeat protein